MVLELDVPPPPDDLALLVAHQDRVRRLVLALLRDEHATEDVMQDAWVRTLSRGPRDPGRSGAWFARVAERLALNRLRGQRRRDRREREAARDEALPSSAEIAARVELSRRVLDALEELPAPYRAALRDRYLGGLGPRELARRDGLPLETVRSRLARGRAALRARLESESFDQEGPWTRALLPLVGLAAPGAAPAPLSLVSASSLGVLVMKKVALVVVVSLVVLGVWQLRPGAALTAPADAARAAAVPAAADGEEIGAASEPLAEVEPGSEVESRSPVRPAGADPSQSSTWGIDGKVVLIGPDGARAPTRSFEVQVDLFEGYAAAGAPSATAVLDSGLGGAFRWELPEPEGVVSARAWVQDAEYLTLGVEDVVAELGASPPEFRIQLVPLDATLEGFVRAPDGTPVPGARVIWSEHHATCDEDGAYRLPVACRWLHHVSAMAEGYGQGVASMTELEPGAVARLDLTLTDELRLSGVVRDEGGAPLVDAQVQTFHGRDMWGTTDAQGRYELPGLPRGVRESLLVYARKQGYCQADARLDIPAQGHLVQDLVLTRGARVAGTVVGAQGLALGSAEVWIGFSRHSFDRLETVSDTDGRFVFEAVPAGARRLTAEHSNGAPATITFQVPVGAVNVEDLVLELRPGRSVAGVVHDQAGDPVQGIGVSAQVGSEYVNSSARTDEHGHFELEKLPDGPLRLSTYAMGWVQEETLLPSDHVGEVLLTVRRAGTLRGRVVDGATGAPVTHFTIRLVAPVREEGDAFLGAYSAVWSTTGKTFDDDQGRWDLGDEEFAPGSVTGVEASAPGYAPSVVPRAVVAAPGEDSDVVVTLNRPVQVAVHVHTDPGDAPLAGAHLIASMEQHPSDTDPTWRATTDAAGGVAWTDMAPGSLWITVERPRRMSIQLGPFLVRDDQPRQLIDVPVPAGAVLRGVVRDDLSRTPLPGADLTLIAHDVPGVTHTNLEAVAGQDGSFRFDDLSPGLYYLARVRRAGERRLQELSIRVRVEPGTTELERDLVGPRGSASISGAVTSQLDLSTAVTVSLLQRGDDLPPARATWVEDGRYTFEGLAPGSYLVSVAHMVRGTGRMVLGGTNVELEDGQVAEFDLELEEMDR